MVNIMLGKLLNAKRSHKRAISILYDVVAIITCLYLALSLRLGTLLIDLNQDILLCFLITLAVSISVFVRLGLYRAILRYAPTEAVFTVFLGTGVSSLTLASSSFFFSAEIPRSSPIIFFLASLIVLGAPRLVFRSVIQLINQRVTKLSNRSEPIIIYGAGYSGYQLSLVLEHENAQYKVIGFVDDNLKLKRSKLRGVTIHHSSELHELASAHGVKTVLLAMGNTSRSQKSDILRRLDELQLRALTIPAIQEIVSGEARITDIKPVAIEDLLGRDPVPPVPNLMGACITGKSVLVTGAGGSIGSELCLKIMSQAPKQLILFEISEFNLYKIEQKIRSINSDIRLFPIIGSIQDRNRLKEVMESFQVDTIYHAAAYKHVPLVEHNIIEGVKNNILGTWNCAEAAIEAKVKSFVLISTDKAVRPTNIMGTTKRTAELVLQALTERQTSTSFTMVRFGNVLGSSGSVVPLFREQIAKGGPVTITHPDITRYFMTIPEAAELVIQAGAMGKGGDVFVLDMGNPVKIVDLARQMIHLSGLDIKNNSNSQDGIELQFTGLRPGEKLYEELLIGDNVTGTEHPLIMRAEEKSLSWSNTKALLDQIMSCTKDSQYEETLRALLQAPTDYQGNAELQDITWQNRNTDTDTLRLIVN